MSCNKTYKSFGALSAVLLVTGVTILVVVPGAWAQSKLKTLYKFMGRPDGGVPTASLIFDAAGNLYGTTQLGGGAYNNGTVFELTTNSDGSWTEKIP
jgi:uncharacterized repeat protein (TIGR03803 family)